MSECRDTECTNQIQPNQRTCPINGRLGKPVPRKTILYQLSEPWQYTLGDQQYYFCADPECAVIYFADDDSVIYTRQLRTRVGFKETSNEALICYCFGVTREQALRDQEIRTFVREQTRQSRCDCTNLNPSARCCLKDFPS